MRIHAPDPTAWAGLDVVVGADGGFDFGRLRAGHYTVVATGPGRISRVVDVDTRVAPGDAIEVYAYPCTDEIWTVHDRGAPVPASITSRTRSGT